MLEYYVMLQHAISCVVQRNMLGRRLFGQNIGLTWYVKHVVSVPMTFHLNMIYILLYIILILMMSLISKFKVIIDHIQTDEDKVSFM